MPPPAGPLDFIPEGQAVVHRNQSRFVKLLWRIACADLGQLGDTKPSINYDEFEGFVDQWGHCRLKTRNFLIW